MDELWSFVGSKKQQRWLWYAYEPRLKRIIAHAFGDRSEVAFEKLKEQLAEFDIAFWCTDNYVVYRQLPSDKHIVGKLYTQRIERQNLTLRTRLKRLNRKTNGYSRCIEMHDKVIGNLIETLHYI